MDTASKYASPEELRYAKVLDIGVKAGLVLLVVSFVIYISGMLPPLVPFDQLAKYWRLPVKEFVAATHTPIGWGWVGLIDKGDILSLAAVVLLVGVSALCPLAVLPLFARRGEIAHLLFAALLVVVLVVAASNILTAGH
jgi:hypothetical protein